MITFGLQYNIVPLLEEIGQWFKSSLDAESFGRSLDLIDMLKTIGFSEEVLAEKILLIPTVVQFVNNSSREEFPNLLADLNLVMLKMLLRVEINYFDVLLNTLGERVNSVQQCEEILEVLDRMFEPEHTMEVLCVFSSEVNSVVKLMIQFFFIQHLQC